MTTYRSDSRNEGELPFLLYRIVLGPPLTGQREITANVSWVTYDSVLLKLGVLVLRLAKRRKIS